MGEKLKVIDGLETTWGGLWWHPETNCFSSQAISLAELRKFKGNVRLYIRKNKYFNGGENGRPNYNFVLRDAKSDKVLMLEIGKMKTSYEHGSYYTEDGEKLYTLEEVKEIVAEEVDGMYTHDQVQYAIDCASEDGARGYGPGDNIVSDYL